MNSLFFLFLPIFFFSFCISVNGLADSSLIGTDYDNHGCKVDGNEVIFAQGLNYVWSTGSIGFSFVYEDYTNPNANCFIIIQNSVENTFIYQSAIGKNDLSLSIFFTIENPVYDLVNSGNLISTAMSVYFYNSVTIGNPSPFQQCNQNSLNVIPLVSYHEEFMTIAVSPNGDAALIFGNTFAGILHTSTLTFTPTFNKNIGTSIYIFLDETSFCYSCTFGPRAAIAAEGFVLVAGWQIYDTRRSLYVPTLFLFYWNLLSPLMLVDAWLQTDTGKYTFNDADTWNDRHMISLDFQNNTLVMGIQAINTVYMFRIVNLHLVPLSSFSQSPSTSGFGKSVSYMDPNRLVILDNTYSADYSTVQSPSVVKIYTINISSSNPLNTNTPLEYTYPNYQQTLPTYLYSTFIEGISTGNALFIADLQANILGIPPSPPGYFSPTVTGADLPAVCPPGTYKSETSVESCSLCPAGTKNPGLNISTGIECELCAANSFCPLGSVSDVDSNAVETISQAFAYPLSPDVTVFEDIMIQNVFTIGSGSFCRNVSPAFWAAIMGGIGFLVFIFMLMLKWVFRDTTSKTRKVRKFAKFVFKRLAFVTEGEHWIGGLATLSLLVMVLMALDFVVTYIQQYPFETAPNPGFACTQLYNAQFYTGLQSLGMPPGEDYTAMHDLLNNQEISLIVEFINTQADCSTVSVNYVRSASVQEPSEFTCLETNKNASISIIVTLPTHSATMQFNLMSLGTTILVGGLRVGMSGDSESEQDEETGNYQQLAALSFYQSYYQLGETLQSTNTLPVQITKVINLTEPLTEGDSSYVQGIWIPTFTTSNDDLFQSQTEFNSAYANDNSNTGMSLTVSISETVYWIQNEQSPIVRQSEVSFKFILFVIMLLEVFGLFYILLKLSTPAAKLINLKVLMWLGKKANKPVVEIIHDSSDDEPDEDVIEIGAEGAEKIIHHHHHHLKEEELSSKLHSEGLVGGSEQHHHKGSGEHHHQKDTGITSNPTLNEKRIRHEKRAEKKWSDMRAAKRNGGVIPAQVSTPDFEAGQPLNLNSHETYLNENHGNSAGNYTYYDQNQQGGSFVADGPAFNTPQFPHRSHAGGTDMEMTELAERQN